jgi:hypothetical protein
MTGLPNTDQLLRLDQLARALDLPRNLLAEVPPARPARGRYFALYSLAAARRFLGERGIAPGRLGAAVTG